MDSRISLPVELVLTHLWSLEIPFLGEGKLELVCASEVSSVWKGFHQMGQVETSC